MDSTKADEEKAWIVAESLDPATTTSAMPRRCAGCSSAWSRAAPRPTSSNGCRPGTGRSSVSVAWRSPCGLA